MLLWAFSGACACFIVAALCRIMPGTINKFVSSAVRHTTRESSRLLGLGSTRSERRAEQTGCNFWICGVSEENSTSQSCGRPPSYCIRFNNSECWSVVLLTFVFPLPVIALSAVVSHVYTLPLRTPRRWCLHHSGPRASLGWKRGESACLNEGAGRGGL